MASTLVDVAALIARLPGCGRLEPEAVTALRDEARTLEFPAGARLLTEGEPTPDWYCVVATGAVQVTRVDAEADEILDYLAAGDVLDPGTPGLPAACSATAVESTCCLFLSQSTVARCRGRLALELAVGDRGELALFTLRVGDLMKGPPVTCGPATSAAAAAALMTSRGVGSVAIVNDAGSPIGIVTDRDLRARVLAGGRPATSSVADVMSSPLCCIERARPAFEALIEMTRRGFHHLGVLDSGRLVGVVSSHDIILLQGAHPVALVQEIEGQADLDRLAAVATRVQPVVKWLADAGATAHDIGGIVAELNDRMVRRALALVVDGLEAQGAGRPPLGYAWLAAGSEGRREQTLKTDQDNGLVYADPRPDQANSAATYFRSLAAGMGDALVRLGFPACAGGFMASNERWCQPERVWRGYFDTWMETPNPEQILRASIFFDLRPIGGDEALGSHLWDFICDRAPEHALFLSHLARAALERRVPLGLFGGFIVERSGAHKDTIDLKARGVFPMTQAMRAYALSIGARETNTVDRLLAAGRHDLFSPDEVEDLRDSYEVISRLRLDHQLACVDAGRAPDNHVDPTTLRKSDRVLLKQAFKALGWLERRIADRFHTELLA